MSWTSSPGDDRSRDPNAGRSPTEPPGDERPPAYNEYAAGRSWPDETGRPQFGEPASRAQLPKSIRTAVRLMYVGAGIAVLSLISVFAFRDDIRDAAAESALESGMSESEASELADTSLTLLYGAYAIAIGLWLWMAYANRRGKMWARAAATVLGGLFIAYTLLSLISGGGGLNFVLSLATLVLAAYILYLLYRPESSEFYRATSRRF